MREVVAWAMVVYLMLLLSLTFYPFGGTAGVDGIEVRLTPFETIRGALRLGPGSREYGVLIGNLVAFVPVGLLIPLLVRRHRAVAAIAAGFLLSLAIEILQLAISVMVGFTYRIADVDDVIVNTLGAILGSVLWAAADTLRAWLAPAR